ncbi:Hypothetical protein POVN_LOCUS621 [uncultured virus]|nr:Hypothetical protein POVN_LOCUS621 [uncultured virus]
MTSFVVDAATLAKVKEKNAVYTDLPAEVKGMCIWFIESPPPVRDGVEVLDVSFFKNPNITAEALIELIQGGATITDAIKKYTPLHGGNVISTVRRVEQGAVINVILKALPKYPAVGLYSANRDAFSVQRRCFYHIRSQDRKHGYKTIETVGCGNVVQAISTAYALNDFSGDFYKGEAVNTERAFLLPSEQKDPLSFCNRVFAYAKRFGQTDMFDVVKTRVRELLHHHFKHHHTHPIFDFAGMNVKAATTYLAELDESVYLYATIDKAWYAFLTTHFSQYAPIFEQWLSYRQSKQNIKKYHRIQRDGALTMDCGVRLAAYGLYRKWVVSQLEEREAIEAMVAEQSKRDYTLWRERAAAQHKRTALIEGAREAYLQGDAKALIKALRGQPYNHVLAVYKTEAKGKKRKVIELLREIIATGGVREGATFTPLIPNFLPQDEKYAAAYNEQMAAVAEKAQVQEVQAYLKATARPGIDPTVEMPMFLDFASLYPSIMIGHGIGEGFDMPYLQARMKQMAQAAQAAEPVFEKVVQTPMLRRNKMYGYMPPPRGQPAAAAAPAKAAAPHNADFDGDEYNLTPLVEAIKAMGALPKGDRVRHASMQARAFNADFDGDDLY